MNSVTSSVMCYHRLQWNTFITGNTFGEDTDVFSATNFTQTKKNDLINMHLYHPFIY